MTTAATEPRAPETTTEPSVRSAADPPSEREGALRRIVSCYPELERKVLDWTCPVSDRMSETFDAKGVDCMADAVEFIENWTPENSKAATEARARNLRTSLKAIDSFREKHGDAPVATFDLSEIRERVQRIAGVVEAAYLCEGSITHGSGDKDAIEDYFTAVSGSISVAARDCRRLLADMDGKLEGGAS